MNNNTTRKSLVETLQEMTKGSGELYRRANVVFPGGAVGGGINQNPWPIYMERGEGAFIWDVDNNRYIDCSLGSGSLLFGHCHPYIQSKIELQNQKGIMHSSASALQVFAAEKLSRIFPCTEKLIFCNSGTEAIHKSIMLSRAHTHKNKIAKFEGSYHGSYDQSCISVIQFSENEISPQPIPLIAGIPQRALDETIVLPFNNSAAFDIIIKNVNDLAAIIVEPIATIGLFSMSKNFLLELKELATKNNILLIFDEVLTGFRVGYGGCQAYFGVVPDIAAYGKVLGGGTPVAAVGCKERTLRGLLNAKPPLRLGGTFSGNPLSMAAANAVLDLVIEKNYLSESEKKCHHFSTTLNEKLKNSNLSAHVTHMGSMFFVHLGKNISVSPRGLWKEDMKKHDELSLRLRLNGVYLESAHTGFLSSSHTNEIIDQLVDVFFKCISECFE